MDKMSSIQDKAILPLSMGALGVVYGDIGTSPLYAFRESLLGLPVSPENVLGILSLIFWSLVIVISIKYLCYILRADNDGEGGVLALLALLKRENGHTYKFLFLVGILGAGLLLGDGMITPAISVVSAIEGLQVISPAFSQLILPLTCIILLALFLVQRHGTAKIGRYFGPVILIWFITLAILGTAKIIQNPMVMSAVNPYYAIEFFIHNGWTGYAALGGVFLVVTGGEALYADLGHFGKTPIRLGWFVVALPGLLLNYFGQGAYLLQYPDAIVNPFYAIAPSWFSYPLLIIATMATIIASQAVISATFSLTKQAVLLDLYPRLPIIQTSEKKKGQIYVPQMNTILAIGTLILVITFKNSSSLAHAYGIAVNLVMLGVTIMVTRVAYIHWHWSMMKVVIIFSLFLFVEIVFLGANAQKIITGGWVSLLFAAICAIVMVTWQKGMGYLRASYYKEKVDIKTIIDELSRANLHYIPNLTTIFISDPYDKSGGALLHYLKLNHIVPEHILIVSITIGNHPYIPQAERHELTKLGKGIYRLTLHYGFKDLIDIPEALSSANKKKIFPFTLDVDQATFLVEIAQITATRRKQTLLFFWQEKLFAFLMRNAALDIEFFQLPYNRTVAIGTYCEI
ncbi:MAG: KUP/HAK/KT family potassium transporter [Gammaproteobacteria bacterium]